MKHQAAEQPSSPEADEWVCIKTVYDLAACFDAALAEADEQGLMDDLTSFNTRIVVATWCLEQLNSLSRRPFSPSIAQRVRPETPLFPQSRGEYQNFGVSGPTR